MPLLVHGEVTDPDVDIFDREAVFLDKVLAPLLARHPGAEGRAGAHHDAARAWRSSRPTARAWAARSRRITSATTATPSSRAASVRTLYCLPIAKSEEHRLALRRAATSGSAQFFLGTDTAPHTADTKECACGCAGIFNAPVAMQVYAQVFAEEDALDRLEAFASLNGPRFYGLLPNEERITLQQAASTRPNASTCRAATRASWSFGPTRRSTGRCSCSANKSSINRALCVSMSPSRPEIRTWNSPSASTMPVFKAYYPLVSQTSTSRRDTTEGQVHRHDERSGRISRQRTGRLGDRAQEPRSQLHDLLHSDVARHRLLSFQYDRSQQDGRSEELPASRPASSRSRRPPTRSSTTSPRSTR